MEKELLIKSEQLGKKRNNRKTWKTIVSVLASIVVFCTTYALILPAITMEAKTYCGKVEHEHGDECYETKLICSLSDKTVSVEHKHTDECYEEKAHLICEQKESEGHTHSDACKKIETLLDCGQEESEEHTHSEECYKENVSYVCGQEESEGHTHSENCYKTEKELVCEKKTEEVTEEHVHTEDCYEKTFVCEKTEHKHDKSCYSDKDADVETASDWEKDLPEELTGVWADDVLAVADSQLGYTESTKNYVIDEDGKIRGYSRYGDWYGDSYGHWCAMFVSFCLNYAEVDEAIMPYDASCQNWIETLSEEEYDLYREAGEYEPVPGDLIFFNWDSLPDSDHVGFVYEIIEATDDHGVRIKTIEGNASDTVKYRTYDIDDNSIMGYAQLPKNPEVEEEEKVVEEEEKGVLAKVFSLAKSAESTDSYAPDVTLGTSWGENVLKVANSQIYTSLTIDDNKYANWFAEKYGNTLTDEDALFATYCLHYANIDSNILPYYTSGDAATWVATLKGTKFYHDVADYSPEAGDLVIWTSGSETKIGVLIEVLYGTSPRVVRATAATQWNAGQVGEETIWNGSGIVGYVEIPKGKLTYSEDGVLSATATYEYGKIPEGTNLVVQLLEANAAWDNLLKDDLASIDKGIMAKYYVKAYFEQDGVKYEPTVPVDIKIDFATVLKANKLTTDGSGELKWEYRSLRETNVTALNVEEKLAKDSGQWVAPENDSDLMSISFEYTKADALALVAMQKCMVRENLSSDFGTTTVQYYNTAIPYGAKIVVSFSEQSDKWGAAVKAELLKEKKSIRKTYFLRVYALKDGEELPIDGPIDVAISFNPKLSANKNHDDTLAGELSWVYKGGLSDGSIQSHDNVQVTVNDGYSQDMDAISFEYDGLDTFVIASLQAVKSNIAADTDIGIVNAAFNAAAFDEDVKLIANLVTDEEHIAVWNASLEDKYASTDKPGYKITNTHFLEVFFENQDGVRVEPEEGFEIDISAQFTPTLDSNASAYEKSEELSWFVDNISTDENQNIVIGELVNEKTVTVDDEDDITSFDFKYEKADVFSFTAMQESYTFLNTEQTIGDSKVTISAVGKTAVLPEGSKIVVEFVENEEVEQILKSTHETERYKLANTQIFTIKFLDAQGNEFSPEENAVDIKFTIDPALSAVFEDGTLTIGEWVMNYVADNEGTLTITDPEETDAVELSMTDDFELTEVSFLYTQQDYYSLSAKMDDPAYKTEVNVSDYQGLEEAIENAGSEKTVITLNSSFEAEGTIEIPAGKNIVVDLAGQTITTSDSPLFNITGGRLTIQDSKAASESVETVSGTLYGNDASYEGKTLTYYATVPTVTNLTMGQTKEHLEKHTVGIKGEITGGSVPAIVIESGTVNLESGAITNYTNRAIVQKSGTLNLKGGYICGNTATKIEVVDGLTSWDNQTAGGAIYVTGDSKLNISGSVLAANSVPERGGAIAVESNANAVVKMTGGVLSGNMSTSPEETSNASHGWHYGGGGIALYGNASMTMYGGYITNNKVCSAGYFEGGGGIFLADSTRFTMLDGKITGNYAAGGGGGIRSDFMGAAYTNTIISGGFVSSNYAHTAEGGGISIGWDGVAHVTGGFVTNNRTSTVQHWGGGGLFVANGGKLYIKNALVTENTAGGFGGGVAGCSTGHVFLISDRGSAIWGNEAEGTTVTDGSEKAEDKIYGKNNPVFMENGFADYFCALTSTVEGNMIGGGASNWKGSADEVPVTIGKNQSYTASYVMGLTASPNDTDKATALSIIKSSNGVYINGNDSHTHGGGVLCNGYLVFGQPGEIDFSTGLEVHGTKQLLDGTETEIPLVDADGNPVTFKFYIVDANTNTVVSTGKNNEDGAISFSARIPFAKAGTFTYYVYEDQDYNSDGFVMDTSKYRITVDVEAEKSYLNKAGEDTIIKTQYVIKHITVEKSSGNGNWTTIKSQDISWANEYEYAPVVLPLTDSTTFKNYKLETTKVAVEKKWAGEVTEDIPQITVGLYKVSKVKGETPLDPELVGEKIILSEENNWSHAWNEELPLISEDGNTTYEYSVIEDELTGYVPSYEVNNKTILDEATGQYINITTYVITNTKTEELKYTVDVTKISDEKSPSGQDIPLGNAEFEFAVKNSAEEKVLYFLKESDGSYILCDETTEGATTTLITNFRGKLVLKELPAGTYVLEETKAPNGYLIAEEKEFILGEESESTTITYKMVDEREILDYELPETGGPGTNVYTAGGILLLMISVLLYIKKKNQKKGGQVFN